MTTKDEPNQNNTNTECEYLRLGKFFFISSLYKAIAFSSENLQIIVNPLHLGNPKTYMYETVMAQMTQMKYRIMLYIIGVYNVWKGKCKKDLQTQESNLTPLGMYNGLSQVNCIKPEGIIIYSQT